MVKKILNKNYLQILINDWWVLRLTHDPVALLVLDQHKPHGKKPDDGGAQGSCNNRCRTDAAIRRCWTLQ